jgi:hypothetical protein
MSSGLEDAWEITKIYIYIFTPLATGFASLVCGLLYGPIGAIAPPAIVSAPMIYYLHKREKQSLEAMLKSGYKIRDIGEVVEEFKGLIEKQKNNKKK